MICIIDYGLGNIKSVAGAVARLGFEVEASADPDRLACAEKLILPGVGAFGDGMRRLRELGLIEPLDELVIQGRKPILGICLGCQLFARESHEFGHHRGLGWLDASVVRIDPQSPGLRVPHVGWNDLHRTRDSPLFRDIPEDALFYFVHSYHVICETPGVVTGETEYGIPLAASFERDNLFATQFHPEKSQQHGLKLLENFLSWTNGCSGND